MSCHARHEPFLLYVVKKSHKGSLFPSHTDYLCAKIFVFLCFLAVYEAVFASETATIVHLAAMVTT